MYTNSKVRENYVHIFLSTISNRTSRQKPKIITIKKEKHIYMLRETIIYLNDGRNTPQRLNTSVNIH
jgi:hypothetical protein